MNDDGTLRDGASTETFTRILNELPVDVIGVNCSAGPKVALETIEKMAALTTKPLSAMPNAGLPATVEGRNIYLCSPEYMAQYSRRFIQVGARIFGGCCGTTPDHIKLICSEVRSFQPAQHGTTPAVIVEEGKPEVKRLAKVPLRREIAIRRETCGGQICRVRRDSSPARSRRIQGNRGRAPLPRSRHRLHQRSRRSSRQRPVKRPSNLPTDPAAGWNRSSPSFLLPRPQHSQHSIGTVGRAHGRRAESDLHYR